MVGIDDVRSGIRSLGLSGKALCVHSSLGSFGHIEDGAHTVVRGLLDEGCTLLVPTFSSRAYEVRPPAGMRLARNGLDGTTPGRPMPPEQGYTPASREIDPNMGAIPVAVLATDEHVRSPHPIRSFTAIGPRAAGLISDEGTPQLFGPLEALASVDGFLLLMGVGLDKATVLHLAEQEAGRRMFVRWASGRGGSVREVETGGCSNGFDRLAPVLAPLERSVRVGQSLWRAYPSDKLLEVASRAMRADPTLTHCSNDSCVRCDDAIRGGPVTMASQA